MHEKKRKREKEKKMLIAGLLMIFYIDKGLMWGHQKKHCLGSWSTIAYKTEDNYLVYVTTELRKWYKPITDVVQQEYRRCIESRLAK